MRYRKPLNLNVGMIIFTIIFIYMIFSVYTYMKREKIQFYEVVEGGIVNDKEYTGIILRSEETQSTDTAGYINYYVREGKRASVGTRIYSIDETGSMSQFLEEHSADNISLTDDNLSDLKKQLSGFSQSYDDEKFSTVYDIQYSMEAAVLEYVNFNALDNLDQLMSEQGINFKQVKASKSGVVSYAVDQFETLDPSTVSAATFDKTSYTKAITKSGQLVEIGAPIYKIVTSDDWSVVFPMSEDDVTNYGGQTSLKVAFSGRDLSTTGDFSTFAGTDGSTYGKIDFHKYMVQFVSDRYVDFEIESTKVDGLKIPSSAVATKDFYTIPLAYLSQGGDGSDTGFYKEVYGENGTSVVFTPVTIYYSTDESYYIETGEGSPFQDGDYIVKPESSDRFQVGVRASLQGVYNINKGYAVFKQIAILNSNDEYYTIEKNTQYGLAVYDHIVLDANTVTEGQLIYQ